MRRSIKNRQAWKKQEGLMKKEYYILENKDGDFYRNEGIGEVSYYWMTNEIGNSKIFYKREEAEIVASKHGLTIITFIGKPFVDVPFEHYPITRYLKAPKPESSRWMDGLLEPYIPRG